MLPDFSESLRYRAWQTLSPRSLLPSPAWFPSLASLLPSSFPFAPQVHCHCFCSLGPTLLSLWWVSVHLNLLRLFPCAFQPDARWWLVPMFGFCVWHAFSSDTQMLSPEACTCGTQISDWQGKGRKEAVCFTGYHGCHIILTYIKFSKKKSSVFKK